MQSVIQSVVLERGGRAEALDEMLISWTRTGMESAFFGCGDYYALSCTLITLYAGRLTFDLRRAQRRFSAYLDIRFMHS